MALQRGIKGVVSKLLKGSLDTRLQLWLAANRSFEGSHKGRAPDEGSHSASSSIRSAFVPRRTSPRWYALWASAISLAKSARRRWIKLYQQCLIVRRQRLDRFNHLLETRGRRLLSHVGFTS